MAHRLSGQLSAQRGAQSPAGEQQRAGRESAARANRAALVLQGSGHDIEPARTLLHSYGSSAALGEAASPNHTSRIEAEAWLAPGARMLAFDELVHSAEDRALAEDMPMAILLRGAGAALAEAALGVATRYQRLWPRCNEASRHARFGQVLQLHRALHDRSKPLVRADYEHALDVWQWVLRLRPEASGALQVAALFHDIERLTSEADVRVEQHAADYLAFKLQHASRGAGLLLRALAPIDDTALVTRAAELVARHEQPGDDSELRDLNDADALSFFALNSAGFFSYFGPEHTEKKVRYTVRRISSVKARALLGSLRLEPFVASRLAHELADSQP